MHRRWCVLLSGIVAAVVLTLAVPAGASTAPQLGCPAVAVGENAAHNGHTCSTVSPALTARWTSHLNGYPGVPLVAAGRVFVTTSTSGPYGASLYALSQATGRPLWGPVRLDGAYWRFPLAYDAGRVFVNDFDGTLRAFDARTGRLLWTTATRYYSGYPTATGGRVYVQGAGLVYAVSETTGRILWVSPELNGTGSSVAVETTGAYVSAVCSRSRLNLASGTITWQHTTCYGGGSGTASLWGGRVYGTGFHDVADKVTGHQVGSFAGAPAFNGTRGYFAVGSYVFCEDVTTQTPKWTHYLAERIIGAPVTTGNGLVVVLTGANQLIGLNGTTGKRVFVRTVPLAAQTFHYDPLDTGFSVGNGAVVVPNAQALSLLR